MNKFTLILLSVTLLIGLFWGCEKKNNPSSAAPVLPPKGTMSIDFTNFVTSSKSGNTLADINGINAVDKSNWVLASTTAGVWNVILAVNLVVPVASFELAVNNKPVYLENNTWEWRYTFTAIGGNYKSRLTGQVRANDVKWEMYITREGAGAFSEILWYEGTSKLDGTSGQWVLNHSQQFLEPMLQIDWVAQGSGVRNIKYTYIRDMNDNRTPDLFKTSFIEYGLTTNDLNAFYTVHQNTGVENVFSDTFIEWNTTNHTGHIKSNNYFQDVLWHCWSASADNINCN
jgi:hypothetical protein